MAPDEKEINQLPIVRVKLSSLTLADSPRLSGESREHIETLAAAQNELPPIIVHQPTMRVIDGFHRFKAAALRGEDEVAVRFFDGDEDEAFVLAVKLNVTHGLPLALADRKRAAERIIASHPQWSDRRVASVTGISPGTAAEIRRSTVGRSDTDSHRIGQDGRVRPLDGTAGRQLAGRLLAENPGLSLRQVAQVAAISPETVRDVRNRLRRGEELIPRPRTREQSATGGPGRPKKFGAVGHVQPSRQLAKAPVPDPAAVVKWLKADPTLRYTERGRDLLRLLTLHMRWTEDWDAIVTNVPPHCSDIVADLARQFADLWTDLAARAQVEVAQAQAG